jgi:hypothetical protein
MISAFIETVGALGILASIVVKIAAFRREYGNKVEPREASLAKRDRLH